MTAVGYRHTEETKSKMSQSQARVARSGNEHPNWRGGRYVSPQGYARVWLGVGHPLAGKGGYAMEHRLVMIGMLGRLLTPTETVHHIDGDRLNNHPTNLQLRSGKHGNGVSHVCGDCGSINILSAAL